VSFLKLRNFRSISEAPRLKDVDVQMNRKDHGPHRTERAGKTTFFNLVSGFLKPSSGDSLQGEVISGLPPHRVARRGIVRTTRRRASSRAQAF